MRASILFPVHISDTYTITQFFVRPSVLWLTCFKQSSSLFSYPPLSLFLLFCISPFLSPSLNYSPIRSLQLASPYLSVFQFESQSISSPSFITCLNSIELSLSLSCLILSCCKNHLAFSIFLSFKKSFKLYQKFV